MATDPEADEFIAFQHPLWFDQPLISGVIEKYTSTTKMHWWISRYCGEWKDCTQKQKQSGNEKPALEDIPNSDIVRISK